jgi:hypothetical protein
MGFTGAGLGTEGFQLPLPPPLPFIVQLNPCIRQYKFTFLEYVGGFLWGTVVLRSTSTAPPSQAVNMVSRLLLLTCSCDDVTVLQEENRQVHSPGCRHHRVKASVCHL